MHALNILCTGLVLAVLALPAHAQFNFNFNKLIDAAKNIRQSTAEIGEAQEADIGKDYAALLVGAAPLWANADAQRYVNSVGRWLSLHSERPALEWRFGVLDSGNINAFATPGGYVFITKGLLVRLKSEAELAGVLGHEIVHVVRKHHLNAIRKGAGMAAGAGLLADYASNRTGPAAEKLVSGMKEVLLRGLDKDDEFEADSMGVVIAARAGYDPYGLPAVLQMLQSLNPQDSGLALMFETHPSPGARLDMIEQAMSTRLDSYANQAQAAERFAGVMQNK